MNPRRLDAGRLRLRRLLLALRGKARHNASYYAEDGAAAKRMLRARGWGRTPARWRRWYRGRKGKG